MNYKSIDTLAERIKYIRKINGLSQIDLAKLAGTTQQAIQQAESGKAQNPRYLHKISLDLGIAYEWLTMNITPEKKNAVQGVAMEEKGRDVLNSFYSMPKKDQALMLELMKAREKKE